MGLTRKFKLNQADVMEIVIANDGEGSGVDADLLDGKHAADILPGVDPVSGHLTVGGIDSGVNVRAPEKATASEATAGTNDTKYMTPATTAAAINNALGVVVTLLDEINGEVI